MEKHGGKREGAGRPPKAIEQHAAMVMKKAIKIIYNKDSDEEAQISFLKDFGQTSKGMQFIAEHIFGKAPQVIEQYNENPQTDLSKLSLETLMRIEKEMNDNKK